ncbi:MAG: hypothetical protein EA402_10240 [Planctomycetota bacterium]|nr:MAG: hypothetical protein EA402_10240 [Planctomycetota bacterium]
MECFTLDSGPEALIAQLASESCLQAYIQVSTEELAGVVEPSLMRHLRQMQDCLQQIMGGGFEVAVASNRQGMDLLLTELLALGTWHGWELPLQAAAVRDLPQPAPASGLLGTDAQGEGARCWLQGELVWLSRCREVTDQADMSQHWGS